MLNVYQLRIFVAVAENRKFSLAAERLHLTQPAVSQQVRSLEKYLGLALFERTGQKVELTEAGVKLLPRARELIELASLTEEQIQEARVTPAGRLMLGTGLDAGRYLLPKLITAFKKRYPQVQPSLSFVDSEQLLTAILKREFDFGVVGCKPCERTYAVRQLSEDELMVIVPSKHPLTKRTDISLAELLQLPWVMQREVVASCESLQKAMADRGLSVDALNIVLEVDNVEAAQVAVEAGAGAALISRFAYQRFAGRVKALQLAEPLRQGLYLISRHRPVPSRTQQRFLEFLDSEPGKQILGLA